jgi:hypothetical protein
MNMKSVGVPEALAAFYRRITSVTPRKAVILVLVEDIPLCFSNSIN